MDLSIIVTLIKPSAQRFRTKTGFNWLYDKTFMKHLMFRFQKRRTKNNFENKILYFNSKTNPTTTTTTGNIASMHCCKPPFSVLDASVHGRSIWRCDFSYFAHTRRFVFITYRLSGTVYMHLSYATLFPSRMIYYSSSALQFLACFCVFILRRCKILNSCSSKQILIFVFFFIFILFPSHFGIAMKRLLHRLRALDGWNSGGSCSLVFLFAIVLNFLIIPAKFRWWLNKVCQQIITKATTQHNITIHRSSAGATSTLTLQNIHC